MAIIPAINQFGLAAVISLLLSGFVLSYKYAQRGVYKRYLLSTFLFWAVVLTFVYIRAIYMQSSEGHSYFEILSIRTLLLGIPCFLTLVSLPVVVLNAHVLRLKYCALVIAPIFVVIMACFGWSWATGSDLYVVYSSYSELMMDITSPAVIMRIAIYMAFLGYIIFLTAIAYRLVPLYNQYIQDNVADSDYNVDWVATFIKYVWLVSAAYFLMAFTASPFIITFYLISLILMFGHIVDESLFHKTLDGVEPLGVKWRPKSGFVIASLNNQTNQSMDRLEQAWVELNSWMTSKRPYINVEFSIQDMIEHFRNLTNNDLTLLFKLRGESFQTFVRNYRINRACEIVRECDGDISSKQLFGMVGFSHYSSFSRAFTTVMDISPIEYIRYVRTQTPAKKGATTPPSNRKTLTINMLSKFDNFDFEKCYANIDKCYARKKTNAMFFTKCYGNIA